MKKLLLTTFGIAALLTSASAQTVIYSETFNSAPLAWTLNTPSGANDPDANTWINTNAESAVVPPGCGQANTGNKTLHVNCQGSFCLGTGATYDGGGVCSTLSVCVVTNKRCTMNSTISTIGYYNLNVSCDWIGVGQAGFDYATLQYSIDGGTTWVDLHQFANGATCGGQGQWANYSMPLPFVCYNRNNLKLAFNWTNNDDGVATDPSFATHDLKVTGTASSVGMVGMNGEILPRFIPNAANGSVLIEGSDVVKVNAVCDITGRILSFNMNGSEISLGSVIKSGSYFINYEFKGAQYSKMLVVVE